MNDSNHDPHATSRASDWTLAELELFHDGQLDPAQAAKLEAALREDADLRRRLARVQAIDQISRVALRTAPRRASTGSLRRLSLGGASLLAAAMLIASVIWTTRTPTSLPVEPVGPIATALPPSPASFDKLEAAGVKVLASFETRKPRQAEAARPPRRALPEAVAVATVRPADPALETMLASGNVDGALQSIRAASSEERNAALSTIGAALRSAMTADSVLDKLSPAEQLEVCAVWAREPRLRPVTFTRLAQLQSNPELRDRVAALASQLSESRELLAWVRSYGLLAQAAAPKAG